MDSIAQAHDALNYGDSADDVEEKHGIQPRGTPLLGQEGWLRIKKISRSHL
jgi:hypothetical protein